MVARGYLDVEGNVANVDRLGHGGLDLFARLDGLRVGSMNSDRREQQDGRGSWGKIHLYSLEGQERKAAHAGRWCKGLSTLLSNTAASRKKLLAASIPASQPLTT